MGSSFRIVSKGARPTHGGRWSGNETNFSSACMAQTQTALLNLNLKLNRCPKISMTGMGLAE